MVVQSSGLSFVRGDATQPIGDGPKVIVHCCNDVGVWGAGFVVALSRRWPHVEQAYRLWHAGKYLADRRKPFALGEVQIVQAEADIFVANLIGQTGTAVVGHTPPIRYAAIRRGLDELATWIESTPMLTPMPTVHMPRMGCGLAGGNWQDIEQIIADELLAFGIAVTVYDLP